MEITLEIVCPWVDLLKHLVEISEICRVMHKTGTRFFPVGFGPPGHGHLSEVCVSDGAEMVCKATRN
eukprot:3330188-Karenia_brevis.AAC.1